MRNPATRAVSLDFKPQGPFPPILADISPMVQGVPLSPGTVSLSGAAAPPTRRTAAPTPETSAPLPRSFPPSRETTPPIPRPAAPTARTIALSRRAVGRSARTDSGRFTTSASCFATSSGASEAVAGGLATVSGRSALDETSHGASWSGLALAGFRPESCARCLRVIRQDRPAQVYSGRAKLSRYGDTVESPEGSRHGMTKRRLVQEPLLDP